MLSFRFFGLLVQDKGLKLLRNRLVAAAQTNEHVCPNTGISSVCESMPFGSPRQSVWSGAPLRTPLVAKSSMSPAIPRSRHPASRLKSKIKQDQQGALPPSDCDLPAESFNWFWKPSHIHLSCFSHFMSAYGLIFKLTSAALLTHESAITNNALNPRTKDKQKPHTA